MQIKHGLLIVVLVLFSSCSDLDGEAYFVPIRTDKGYCYIDEKLELISDLGFYDNAYSFSEGRARVYSKSEGWNYIDTSGETILKVSNNFQEAKDFSEGLAAVKINGLWGYVDKQGMVKIKPQWLKALDFSNSFACVQINQNNWNYIDSHGNIVFSDKYFQKANSFFNNMAVVTVDGKTGVIGNDGNFVILPSFNFIIGHFSEGKIVANKYSDKYGYIGTDSVFIIEEKFSQAKMFYQGRAPVAVLEENSSSFFAKGNAPELWGIINGIGEYVLDPQYAYIGEFSEGLAPFQNNDGKFGYIDLDGNTIVEPVYDSAKSFKNGLGAVLLGRDHGYVTKQGEVVLGNSFLDR